jgi:hypothetical protein
MTGWSTNQQKYSSLPNDTLVKSTMMRWGNWDVVTKAPRWNSSEVPTSLGSYGNSVPSNNTLPASFYMSSKPSWWSGTWPAIGPDVTGGNVNDTGGHAYKIPARLCYENASNDPNYPNTDASGLRIRVFNANNCYSTSSLPAPTNLRIVGQ